MFSVVDLYPDREFIAVYRSGKLAWQETYICVRFMDGLWASGFCVYYDQLGAEGYFSPPCCFVFPDKESSVMDALDRVNRWLDRSAPFNSGCTHNAVDHMLQIVNDFLKPHPIQLSLFD